MMEFLTAILLGFIEGLTEFIPVSSTAHLIVFIKGLNFPSPPGHVFEVFIQLGAILAVMVLYRRKLWWTATQLIKEPKARLFALNLVAGTIPALVAGFLAHDWIKEHLYNPTVIAVTLVLGGVVILFLEKRFREAKITSVDDIPLNIAFLIGCCQMMALVPGISRSGATIMGSLLMGLSRPAAAEFSFFLAIPVMLAAVTFDTYKNWDSIIANDQMGVMLAGMLAAFFAALAVIRPALHLISRHGFRPFAYYRIIAGIIIFLIFTL
jgi:undecaprenyl-diphosphatase